MSCSSIPPYRLVFMCNEKYFIFVGLTETTSSWKEKKFT